jgi:hypothetical protein
MVTLVTLPRCDTAFHPVDRALESRECPALPPVLLEGLLGALLEVSLEQALPGVLHAAKDAPDPQGLQAPYLELQPPASMLQHQPASGAQLDACSSIR